MDGELCVKGYKFNKSLHLNLQKNTVITGDDDFIGHELFNMLESFFNKQNFSDGVLDAGLAVILNGNRLSGSEFAVYRIPPVVNIGEELKITKSSILGKMLEGSSCVEDAALLHIKSIIEETVITKVLQSIGSSGVSISLDELNLFSIAKLFRTYIINETGQEVLPQEWGQFQCKSFLLHLLENQQTAKKKLLLVELPEYGMREQERAEWFDHLACSTMDNIMVYTKDMQIGRAVPDIFSYHIVQNNTIYGFDDYDVLELQLREVMPHKETPDITKRVMRYIFNRDAYKTEDEFLKIINEFFCQNSENKQKTPVDKFRTRR